MSEEKATQPGGTRAMLGLSERQQATVAAALTLVAGLVLLCALGALFWLLAHFLREFSNVFLPLAVAGVVALVLEPYYKWWLERLQGGRLERWRLSKVVALFSVFLSFLLPIVAVLWFFGDLLVDQIADLVEKAPAWWESARAWLDERWPQVKTFWESHGLQERIETVLEEQGGAMLAALQALGLRSIEAGANVFSRIVGLLNWVLVPIYVAFILIGDLAKERLTWSNLALPFLKQETRQDIGYLFHEFVQIIVAFFRGQLLIAFLQGVLYAVGFSIVGVRYGWILGLVLGFLNIIPYLGSIVGLGVTVPIALFQEGGGLWKAGAVLIVFTAVQMIEGYLLTPKIMGDQTGLHPMTIMVAIFFWGSALNGIMGMLLAIPLTAFFVVFWRLAREKYITELV